MKYARKYCARFKIRVLPQENIAKNFLAIEFLREHLLTQKSHQNYRAQIGGNFSSDSSSL